MSLPLRLSPNAVLLAEEDIPLGSALERFDVATARRIGDKRVR